LVNSGWLAAGLIATLFMLVYPAAVAIWVHRRLQVSWRFFGYGALIFFLFQILTRIPAVQIIQSAIIPALQKSPDLRWIWFLALALTAGLFEEVGRYVGYRWLFRGQEKTWSRAVMYGVGHGGLEAWFTAILSITTFINLIVLSQTGLSALPPATQEVVRQQIAAVNSQPVWLPLLGAWERFWTLPVQVALSVLVLQVFLQNSLRWLGLAILAHAAVDFSALALGQVTAIPITVRPIAIEVLVAVYGLIGLWVIQHFRDNPTEVSGPERSD